jgi:2-hydroxycyclohexanecarboxyl-CoA dehydrogenase
MVMQADATTQVRTLAESAAVVLGGSSGVGLATALRLARAGSPGIVINGRNAARGAQAVAAVEAAGGTAHFVEGDAGDPADVARVVAEAYDRLGRIDVAVSAVAPPGEVSLLEKIAAEEMLRILDALTRPPLLLAREVVPFMKSSGGGTIISVASDAAKVTTPGEAVVGAGMAAIAMFSRTAAMEVKRHGIRVNVLTPSLIAGTRTSDAILEHELGSKIFEKIAAKAQLGVPSADDVAGLIEFLASPAAAKITGQVISINGGTSAG